MSRIRIFVTAALLTVPLARSDARAANSAVVESKVFGAGQTSCSIGVFLTNDLPWVALNLPLEFRTLSGGAYLAPPFARGPRNRLLNSPLGLPYDNGVDSVWPSGGTTANRYSTPNASNTCSGPVSSTWGASAANLDFISPDAILHSTHSTGNPGAGEIDEWGPGSDPSITSQASYLITFTANLNPGQFEIDSACMGPGAHLYAWIPGPPPTGVVVLPLAFTKGIVSICALMPGGDCDLDGADNEVDNCPTRANADQEDSDGDGPGNVCDNCPSFTNASQSDVDSDGFGDPCDLCPTISDPLQADQDADGKGNACDNCPSDFNPAQANGDGDAFGDACDECPTDPLNDLDNDGHCYAVDNCPTVANAGQEDGDLDGVGNACDNCLSAANSNQANSDSDVLGNACDNCPLVTNANQADGDSDGAGDLCDNCQGLSNPSQLDSDGDALGNACDNCPAHFNASQLNSDGDGLGDACDPCPSDPTNTCSCDCTCHADPSCDGSADVIDVVLTGNRAFRGAGPTPDFSCQRHSIDVDGRTDVDCSGATDVLDLVHMVTVAFRNGNPATEFCDPCQ